jgi:aminopeptidase-like protein
MADENAALSGEPLGRALHDLVERLYPICRSITGDGVRKTLEILREYIDLTVHEVPSGTAVLDWTVPNEWNIRDAWIKNASGEKVVDFQKHNLHVVNYSCPVRARLSLEQLRPRLHALRDRPDWIPYRTTYYDVDWGFCLTQRQLEAMPDGEYEVCIDSTLEPGSLTYGELVLPGATTDEILISTHVCHPSLCDDNLTGIAISVFLARELARRKRHLTLRFLYAPGTIGALTWLARNRETAHRVSHGLTLTCLGDGSPFTYKRTFTGDAEIDRAAAIVLENSGYPHQFIDFFPYGYDERQYNSPGFRLPVGSLMRGRHGQFPEYHTSGDNLGFVKPERMLESYDVVKRICLALDGNRRYQNLAPEGEPQLGRRGLYRAVGGTNLPNLQFAMLWVLNLSDGRHTMLDIARRAGLAFEVVRTAADLLLNHGLLAEVQTEE